MKLFITAIVFLSANYAFAMNCPIRSFEGNFKVVAEIGCNQFADNKITSMENVLNGDVLEMGFLYGKDTEPTFKLFVFEELNEANVECVDTAEVKSYKWHIVPPDSDKPFYMGMTKRGDNYFAERGPSCSYKLMKL